MNGPQVEDNRLPQLRASRVVQHLTNCLMFWIRRSGTVKEIVLRLREDGEIFPLEWFRGFTVTLWKQDEAAIVCDVEDINDIKKTWYFLALEPSADCDPELWDELTEEDIIRIELSAGEVRKLFVWQQDVRLFVREEVH